MAQNKQNNSQPAGQQSGTGVGEAIFSRILIKFAAVIIVLFGLIIYKTCDIPDKYHSEEIARTEGADDDDVYYKICDPDTKKWGVVRYRDVLQNHKKPKIDLDSYDFSKVLPMEYDSIHASSEWIPGTFTAHYYFYGYKNGKIYDEDGKVVDKLPD